MKGMNKPLKILILEDSIDDVTLIERELKRGGIEFTMQVVKAKSEYEKALLCFNPDVILSDHSLPGFISIEAMQLWKEHQKSVNSSVPFILITGSVSEEFAVQTIKSGADDYILKDRLKRLPSSIKGAIEKSQIEQERANYFAGMMAQSELMKEAEHLAGFGSWKVDLNTGEQQWSDEIFRMLGFDPGEVSPSYEIFFRYMHPDDQENIKRIIDEAIMTTQTRECEYRIIDRNNEMKTVHSRIAVKGDSQGPPYQLLGFTVDISEQSLQKEALELQSEKLMEIGRVQSHEVRAPVARIMGLIHMIECSPDSHADIQPILGMIKQSAKELDEVIKKIVRKTE
jgi:CheY-like chemotaxis protein